MYRQLGCGPPWKLAPATPTRASSNKKSAAHSAAAATSDTPAVPPPETELTSPIQYGTPAGPSVTARTSGSSQSAIPRVAFSPSSVSSVGPLFRPLVYAWCE